MASFIKAFDMIEYQCFVWKELNNGLNISRTFLVGGSSIDMIVLRTCFGSNVFWINQCHFCLVFTKHFTSNRVGYLFCYLKNELNHGAKKSSQPSRPPRRDWTMNNKQQHHLSIFLFTPTITGTLKEWEQSKFKYFKKNTFRGEKILGEVSCTIAIVLIE